MIVLDTNVVSELMRGHADPAVVAWVDGHPSDQLYLTSVNCAELRYGVARLPAGRRRTELGELLRQVLGEDFTDRILPFDDEAARHYATIVVRREELGHPISMADAQIAAICRSTGAGLATRNTKDFSHTGVEAISPWP